MPINAMRCAVAVCAMGVLSAASSPAGSQEKDYSDLCRQHPDLIAKMGDGGTLEDYVLSAHSKLKEMGVDLFDLLLWMSKNHEFVNRVCDSFPPFHPETYTIPGSLYIYGDKRALPYAKRYFEEQVQLGRDFSVRAAKCLAALGLDDPESVRMLIGGMRQLDENGQCGFIMIEMILRYLPPDKPMPEGLKEAMWRSLVVATPPLADYQTALNAYCANVFSRNPTEQEMLEIIDLFDKKRNLAGYFYTDSFVWTAMRGYPQDMPLPESVMDRLESLVRSDRPNRFQNGQSKTEWLAENERLLNALSDRRRRDQRVRASEGGTPVSSPSAASDSAVPNTPRPESEPEAAPASKGSPSPSAPSSSHKSWVRIGVAGVVAAVLLAVIAANVLRRRAGPR